MIVLRDGGRRLRGLKKEKVEFMKIGVSEHNKVAGGAPSFTTIEALLFAS